MITKNDYIIAILFALALAGAYAIYKPFLLSMVVALLLTMATANVHLKITDSINSENFSSIILSLLLFIILFVPIIYIMTIGVHALATMDLDIIKQITSKIISLTDEIPIVGSWTKDNLDNQQISETIKASTNTITKAGTQGIDFIKNVFFVIVFYYILNRYAEKLFYIIASFLPMKDKEGNRIIKEISSTMEIVFYSIIVTAIFEGMLFGIVISFFGFNGLLFGTIYGFASLIPFVGGAIVWMPVSLYAWTTLNSKSAIIIALYSVIIISIIAITLSRNILIFIVIQSLGIMLLSTCLVVLRAFSR